MSLPREKSLYEEIYVSSVNKSRKFIAGTKIYKGVSTVNENNTSVLLYDLNLIKQDLLNHFHIRQGEKLGDPTFGTIIWDVLFEPLTPTLRNLIIDNVNAIIANDPRITVDKVTIQEYESGIQIECNLVYLPYNIQESMQLNFDKNAGILSA
tara:strand:+ start:6559 stop:7014 length:456 start_codon:yes stop_codon:yes gene_type:complete